jgi:hypothetical protein
MKHLLLLFAMVLPAGCAPLDSPLPECEGELAIVVPLASVPAKVKVVWKGSAFEPAKVVIDECGGVKPWQVLVERRKDALVINDGSIGYRPPPAFDLQLVDQGTCATAGKTIVDVKDYPTPAAEPTGDYCRSAELTLPASEIHP